MKDKEITNLHQLLECLHHESIKSLIGKKKHLVEHVKHLFELQIAHD